MTNDADVNYEPLPGYRLIERIGAGGYGEVWRCEAPGGLTKAIKLVFGQHHEKRAANEMRALEHVRSVRHPFLLSLERIEVVGGRLVVVTELADSSVKDRFDQCRREGKRGIPREELISYLRDAADALDYMNSTHQLQHLDVKPENLLLLAGHVKVADFGLVKDIRQSQASLVGGMTPLYAAPEVFRGTPSRQSDQYSLAIVYQEMLTGTLPFLGSSAAELTLQHLNDEPDLSSLSGMDRYAVSRALSKDPEHRYANCREFADTLLKAQHSDSFSSGKADVPTREVQAPFTKLDNDEVRQTDCFDEEQSAACYANSQQILLPLPESDCRLVDLPPVDVATESAALTPTLVLGIGGTAGRVLTNLRKTVSEKWGSAKDVPSIQFLLIDTDPRSLGEAGGDGGSGLSGDELLNLPLRRPQHYRENSQQLLHWLSRRWLYNIPRSLRTEGLRPLGRLAFADQARLAGQRIRKAMVQALDPAALGKSKTTLGQEMRSDALRVVVVASISGGTGGGMSIDIGYAVRAIMQKLGLAQTQIIGLMLHATGRDVRQNELARVNAFSWLAENQFFQRSENSYPGDISCGLPAHAQGAGPFDHTYLIQLGDNLDTNEFDQATKQVADYLRLNALSAASVFFDACRDNDKGATPNLRSFGIYKHCVAAAAIGDELAGAVTRHVLGAWRAATGADAQTCGEVVKRLIQSTRLDTAGIAANARECIERELGNEPAAFLTRWLEQTGVGTGATGEIALSTVDRLFGRTADSNGTAMAGTLQRAPFEFVAQLTEIVRQQLRDWLSQQVNDPRYRVNGARTGLTLLSEQLVRTTGELHKIQAAIASRLGELRGASATELPRSSLVDEYFQVSLDQFTICAAEHVVRTAEADLKDLEDELIAIAREIEQIAKAAARAAGSTLGGDDHCNAAAHDARRDGFLANLPEIAAAVDAQLQAEYLDANGGLMKVVMQGGRLRAQLSATLHDLSRRAVQQALVHCGEESESMSVNDLPLAVTIATPALLEYGGRRRVLLVEPIDKTDFPNSAELGIPATRVLEADPNLTICVEADQLSVEHIALEIIERRRDRVEFAQRVHCRTDIAWTPLLRECSSSAAEAWQIDDSRQSQSQPAICNTVVL